MAVDVLSELAAAALDGVRSMTMAVEEGLREEPDVVHDQVASLTGRLPAEIGWLLGETLGEFVALAKAVGWDAETEATVGMEKALAAVQEAITKRSETTAEYPEWHIYADRLCRVFQAVQNVRVDVEHLRDRD